MGSAVALATMAVPFATVQTVYTATAYADGHIVCRVAVQ